MAAPSPKTHSKPATSNTTTTIKFLCSYGGKILPRYPDGQLRYIGGQTRLLSVDRSLSFSEILAKLGEVCGSNTNSVCLRCQLPTEDLDSLVSITSDDDLFNLIEEYERVTPRDSKSLKIKAFLSLPRTCPSTKSGSQSSSCSSTATQHEAASVSPESPGSIRLPPPATAGAATSRCKYHVLTPPRQPGGYSRSSSSGGNSYRFYNHGGASSSRSYLVHNGNHRALHSWF